MNQTGQSWQQELAAIDAEIDTLRQRLEAQRAELRTLQESGAVAPNKAEPTQPYRANFLSCKLDETGQRLCTLELRRESLAFKLRMIERLKQGCAWENLNTELGMSSAELSQRLGFAVLDPDQAAAFMSALLLQANSSSTGMDQPGTAGSASALSPRR